MSDERLDILKPEEASTENSTIKINKIKINNYKFFCNEFELIIDGRNILIYGENGSGKSSIYKALELLAKDKIPHNYFVENLNIFSENKNHGIEFVFSNGVEYTIDNDITEHPDFVPFLKGLAVFTPFLDYKNLLKIHYSTQSDTKEINLFSLLEKLFRFYPVENELKLSDINNPDEYFEKLEKIINNILLSDINNFINYFETDFKIEKFDFKKSFAKNKTIEFVVNLKIEYNEKTIIRYHTFLNEARLAAMSISIYFAIIKNILGILSDNSIKILVLDDLLISLDMNNRLYLLEILKTEFSDFQIFFFTHDKELFEIYKNKLDWKNYELYLDSSESIPLSILKTGKSSLARAKEYFAKKEYDCCALLVRKGFEKFLKSYLTPKEQLDKNCNELDLSGMISRAISKSSVEIKSILQKLDSDRQHLLNPLSHYDNRNIYSVELKTAINDLEKLELYLKSVYSLNKLKMVF